MFAQVGGGASGQSRWLDNMLSPDERGSRGFGFLKETQKDGVIILAFVGFQDQGPGPGWAVSAQGCSYSTRGHQSPLGGMHPRNP